VLKNAKMGRGGAYTNPSHLYEHGMCVLIVSIDTYEN